MEEPQERYLWNLVGHKDGAANSFCNCATTCCIERWAGNSFAIAFLVVLAMSESSLPDLDKATMHLQTEVLSAKFEWGVSQWAKAAKWVNSKCSDVTLH